MTIGLLTVVCVLCTVDQLRRPGNVLCPKAGIPRQQFPRSIHAVTPDTRDILARTSRVSGNFLIQLDTRLLDWSTGGLLWCIGL